MDHFTALYFRCSNTFYSCVSYLEREEINMRQVNIFSSEEQFPKVMKRRKNKELDFFTF